jgi:hypothetical protein
MFYCCSEMLFLNLYSFKLKDRTTLVGKERERNGLPVLHGIYQIWSYSRDQYTRHSRMWLFTKIGGSTAREKF